jgi:MYXO-CTERM domain-containing protein
MKSSLRHASLLAIVVGLAGALAPVQTAEAQELRFSTTQPGNVVAAGNTLGLSHQLSLNGPGTEDSVGTFIRLGAGADTTPLNALNPWFDGTTGNWEENGSAATLTLPVEAEILYAELVWGGSFAYGGEDVSADLGQSVTLAFGGDTVSVAPNNTTAVTVNEQGSFPLRYYMRSGDVTDFVQQHKGGTYATSGVPATQSILSNTSNAAGWTLIVAYRYDNEPIRNMSVFVGGVMVDEDVTVDYPVDGFCAPPTTPIAGTIAIATLEGDADRTGDLLAIGETVADPTFVNLSGPNNPETNFFCSQINDPDGQLDTTGTFGDRNHALGTNVSGGRQGWDVTNVTLSSADGHLVPNQTSAVLRTQTLSDSYMPVLAGIAIDVNAPKFQYDQSTTFVDPGSAAFGEQFTLSVKLVNEGSAPANDVRFTLDVPSGIGLSAFSTNGQSGNIDGAPVPEADLATGVAMGTVAPGDERTVEAVFEVTASGASNIILKPVWSYEYQICVNDTPTDEVFNATAVDVDLLGGGEGGAGGAGGGGSTGGAGEGAAGGAGDGGASDDGGIAYPEGGGFISCSAGSNDSDSGFVGLSLVGLGLVLARRRRAISAS